MSDEEFKVYLLNRIAVNERLIKKLARLLSDSSTKEILEDIFDDVENEIDDLNEQYGNYY